MHTVCCDQNLTVQFCYSFELNLSATESAMTVVPHFSPSSLYHPSAIRVSHLHHAQLQYYSITLMILSLVSCREVCVSECSIVRLSAIWLPRDHLLNIRL